jgi:hypothetical protein
MNMVGHQNIMVKLIFVPGFISPENLDIFPEVFVVFKHILLIISPCQDVTDKFFGRYSRCPRHALPLSKLLAVVNK